MITTKQPSSDVVVPMPRARYEVGDKITWLGHGGMWEVVSVKWIPEKKKHKYELKKLTNTYVFEFEHRLKKVDLA